MEGEKDRKGTFTRFASISIEKDFPQKRYRHDERTSLQRRLFAYDFPAALRKK